MMLHLFKMEIVNSLFRGKYLLNSTSVCNYMYFLIVIIVTL